MVIIVDVMGGDNSPIETVKGLCLAAKENQDVYFVVIGDKPVIEALMVENGCDPKDFYIIHTDTVIDMTDSPMSVVRSKKDSSMSIGLRLLSEGKGSAFVSTGNTGALFTGATLINKKIKGVERAAIATILPMQIPVLLIDSGANTVISEDSAEQFAVMGSAYMKKVYGVESPRVGLLNNGTEDTKGTPFVQSCNKRLSALPGINYVGNVEASAIPFGVCDVVVADGFTGNILLKALEGMGKLMKREMKTIFKVNALSYVAAMMVERRLNAFKKHYDSAEYGGAPLLGISSTVIKAHGSSNAKAFKNAIKQAVTISETGVAKALAVDMAAYSEYHKEQRRIQKTENQNNDKE